MSGGFDGLNIFGSILSRTNKRVGFAIVDTNKDKVVDENEFQNVKAMYKVDQLDFATIDTNRDGEISQTEWARIQVGMDLQNILNNLSGRISSTYSDIDKICQPFVADKLAEAARAFDIDQPNVQEVFTQYMNQLFDQIYEGLSSTAGIDGCRRPGAARDEAQKDFLASLNIYEQGERPEGTTPSYSATCENMIKKAVQAKVKEWTDSHPDEWNTMDIDALEQAKANLRACLEEFMTTEKIQEFENLAKAADITYCQTTVQNYDALNTDYNTNASSLNSQLGELETQVKDLLAVLPSNSQDATTQRAIDGLKNLKETLTTNGQILTSVGNLLNNDDCSRDIAAIKEGLEDTNIGSLAAGDLKAKAEKWFSEITKDQTGLANVKSSMSTLAATFAAIQEGINRKKEPVIIGVDLTNPDTEPVIIDVIYNPNRNQNPTPTNDEEDDTNIDYQAVIDQYASVCNLGADGNGSEDFYFRLKNAVTDAKSNIENIAILMGAALVNAGADKPAVDTAVISVTNTYKNILDAIEDKCSDMEKQENKKNYTLGVIVDGETYTYGYSMWGTASTAQYQCQTNKTGNCGISLAMSSDCNNSWKFFLQQSILLNKIMTAANLI